MVGVYKIENKVNSKVYIGLSKHIKQRWWEHKNALNKNKHANLHLQSSWNKYGENNFSFEVLEKCQEKLLSEREIYWIEYYKSYDRKFGYNETLGGEGYNTIHKVIQFDLFGNIINKFNNAYDAERLTRCDATAIYQCCNMNIKNPQKYIWLYEEDYNRDKNIINVFLSKIVLQYDSDGNFIREWETPQHVKNEIGINPSQCLNHRSLTCNGYIFIYKNDNSVIINKEYFDNIKRVLKESTYTKPILQYSLNGILINRYGKTTDVRKNGYHNGSVIKCCNNKKDTYKGYIWVYECDKDKITKEYCNKIKEKHFKNSSTKKTIIQYTLDGVFVKRWETLQDIHNNGFIKDYVRKCCKHELENYKGYIWRYEEEF